MEPVPRIILAALVLALPAEALAQRATLSLDGQWRIEESVAPEPPPRTFARTVAVPGLANQAVPPFAGIDQFESRELIQAQIRYGALPAREVPAVGETRQKRNYLWYATTFEAPERRGAATLRVGKAQFGTAVWLNGRKIGEHAGCFTAGYFDLTPAIRWRTENRLIVRVGAHPAALPASLPTGTDFEKRRWTPGIYDSVSVAFADGPLIESVQVAPRLAGAEIVVATTLRNPEASPAVFRLSHRVRTWKEPRDVADLGIPDLSLGPGERTTLTETIKVPGAVLWSPENPFLYLLESSTGGDSVSTRFGMRELRFDTATKRAYLNGRVYFLRGSNITLHRFFEDPQCKGLPWNEAWVRRLLGEIPKQLHWNAFRFCIGPVPDRWLEIADEVGLLVQNEFVVWSYRDNWATAEVTRQYEDWIRDSWNHPSVAIWDAANETRSEILTGTIIPAVRKLDLSDRPWDAGYDLSGGPNDPVEDHIYLFGRDRAYDMTLLENRTGFKSVNSPHPTGHAVLLNEYGWLWLNRDGSPTELTRGLYDKLLGAEATPAERFETNAYLLAGLTEHHRAHRNFAGVLHFVYLTCSDPGAFTADHFRDVARLELEPRFAHYMTEAFKPLGVYLNFFRPTLAPGEERAVAVMVLNDDPVAVDGRLELTVASEDGAVLFREERPFALTALGQQSYGFRVRAPEQLGRYVMTAAATANGATSPTLSRRKLSVERRTAQPSSAPPP
jgi:beta-galactosidase